MRHNPHTPHHPDGHQIGGYRSHAQAGAGPAQRGRTAGVVAFARRVGCSGRELVPDSASAGAADGLDQVAFVVEPAEGS
jgi:hypothetical protein